jgi:DNA-binding CsgD family transcriptional regulator
MDEIFSKRLDRLSDRQKQCLALVAEGLSSKEIGRKLGVAPSTVDNHISSALNILGIDDRKRAALVFTASQEVESAAIDDPLPTPKPLNFFKLPPLGGELNMLTARERMLHVFQIALIGMMVMTMIMVVISGIVELLAR